MGSRYDGSPEDVQALDAYIKLVRASDAVAQAVNRPLLDAGLTTSQFGVLEALLHLGPLSHGVLASKILTSPANLSHVIDQLETRGWIRRSRDRDDRRVVRVELTPEGETAILDLLPAHVARVRSAFASLDAESLASMAHMLRTVGHAQRASTTSSSKESV